MYLFLIALALMGWSVGVATTALILRLGQGRPRSSRGRSRSWFQPFSAVFYPVDQLPSLMRLIAFFDPASLPFMLYGLVIAFPRQRGDRIAQPVMPLYLFAGIYTLIHILTWALIRYRLPVDAVLVVFAGLALVDLAGRVPVLRRVVQALA